MSLEGKAIVRGYMQEFLNMGNLEALDKYFSPKGVSFNGRPLTRAEMLLARQQTLRAFPDYHITIEDQIAEGDKVVTRVRFQGTQQGETHGLPPSGKKVSYQGIAMDRILEGKVVEMWHEADTWGMLRQLGATLRREGG